MAAERFPVEAGQIMLFARAVGDPNPVYSDPEQAKESEVGGVIAPPTFVQASAQYDDEYPLRPKIGEPWFGSGKAPTGASVPGTDEGGASPLHAEQHYEYFRPLRPGDVLTARTSDGKTWEKQGRRGGLLRFSEQITDYVDQTGAVVVRARSVSVRPQQSVKQEES